MLKYFLVLLSGCVITAVFQHLMGIGVPGVETYKLYIAYAVGPALTGWSIGYMTARDHCRQGRSAKESGLPPEMDRYSDDD